MSLASQQASRSTVSTVSTVSTASHLPHAPGAQQLLARPPWGFRRTARLTTYENDALGRPVKIVGPDPDTDPENGDHLKPAEGHYHYDAHDNVTQSITRFWEDGGQIDLVTDTAYDGLDRTYESWGPADDNGLRLYQTTAYNLDSTLAWISIGTIQLKISRENRWN